MSILSLLFHVLFFRACKARLKSRQWQLRIALGYMEARVSIRRYMSVDRVHAEMKTQYPLLPQRKLPKSGYLVYLDDKSFLSWLEKARL